MEEDDNVMMFYACLYICVCVHPKSSINNLCSIPFSSLILNLELFEINDQKTDMFNKSMEPLFRIAKFRDSINCAHVCKIKVKIEFLIILVY